MATRDIGLQILKGGQGIQHNRESLRTQALKEIRAQPGLSPSAFAGVMGAGLRTVQKWEQGSREQNGPAKTLLRIAE